MAKLIGADPKEIIFTSGATESNNIAVKGVARFFKETKKHVITTTIVSLFLAVINPASMVQLTVAIGF